MKQLLLVFLGGGLGSVARFAVTKLVVYKQLNLIWGTLAVGIFTEQAFMDQLKGVVVIGIFAFVSSYIVLFVINKLMPLRANSDEESQGLDVEECGLEAYPEFKRAF